jgi:hypothetical protein
LFLPAEYGVMSCSTGKLMIHPAALLFSLIPPLVLAAAVILTRRLRLWLRIVSSGAAVLLSLPFGLYWIVPNDSTYQNVAPIGDGVVPLILGWCICGVLWFIGSALALAGRMNLAPPSS